MVDGNWKELTKGTTIGYKRILRFPSVEATKVRLKVADSKSSPVISNIGIYNAPLFLNAPSIARNQSGVVNISTNDIGPIFYYTLDGSEPTQKANKYSEPFTADGKIEVKAIAFDPASGKSGPVGTEQFGVSKEDWKIMGTDDEKAYAVLDGNPTTTWNQTGNKKMPIDLVIGLGSEQNLKGFKYLPDQNKWTSGTIIRYRFFVSPDGENWKQIDEGEFSNIKNNPVWQIKTFSLEKARFVKFQALKNAEGNDDARYAEVEVVVE